MRLPQCKSAKYFCDVLGRLCVTTQVMIFLDIWYLSGVWARMLCVISVAYIVYDGFNNENTLFCWYRGIYIIRLCAHHATIFPMYTRRFCLTPQNTALVWYRSVLWFWFVINLKYLSPTLSLEWRIADLLSGKHSLCRWQRRGSTVKDGIVGGLFVNI